MQGHQKRKSSSSEVWAPNFVTGKAKARQSSQKKKWLRACDIGQGTLALKLCCQVCIPVSLSFAWREHLNEPQWTFTRFKRLSNLFEKITSLFVQARPFPLLYFKPTQHTSLSPHHTPLSSSYSSPLLSKLSHWLYHYCHMLQKLFRTKSTAKELEDKAAEALLEPDQYVQNNSVIMSKPSSFSKLNL